MKKIVTMFALFFALALGFTQSAFAALPATFAADIGVITTDATAIYNAVFPIVVVVVGFGVVISLVKRFAGKI